MKGLVIGRFQPVADNHTSLLREIDKLGLDEIVLGLGTPKSGFLNNKNPFYFNEVMQMLVPILDRLKTPYSIHHIPDINDPERYTSYVEGITGCTKDNTILISENPKTIKCFTSFGHEYKIKNLVAEVTSDSGGLRGTYVRELIKNNKNWEDFVPGSTAEVVKKCFQRVKFVLDLNDSDELSYYGHVKLIRRNHDGHCYDVVVSKNACALMYIDQADNVWFVKQYRVPVGKEVLELPAETMDKPGKSSLEVMVEGLEEECGIKIFPEQVKYFATIGSSEGHDSEFVDLFYAYGPHVKTKQRLETSEKIEVVKIPFEKAYQMIQTGELQGSKTVALLQNEYIQRLQKKLE